MKRKISIIFCVILCSFMFGQDLNLDLELGLDYGVGFEMGSGSVKLESSKVLDMTANLNANVMLFVNDASVGAGMTLGGSMGFVGVRYELPMFNIGYTATSPVLNTSCDIAFRIDEKNRITVSPMDYSLVFVDKATDFNDQEITVNRILMLTRMSLRYTHFSKINNKTKQGFYVGLGYCFACAYGEKDQEFLLFENNNPIQLTFGGKITYQL